MDMAEEGERPDSPPKEEGSPTGLAPQAEAERTINDAEAYRLSGLKTNLQAQIASVLGYIKKDTNDIVVQIQNRSHNEILRIMNLSMNLVHHLDEVANMRVCKNTSDNPVARALCRQPQEAFNELEYCVERKGFFEYQGVDIHEGPKVKVNTPYLESATRIAYDLKKNIQTSKSVKRANSFTTSKSMRKVPTYSDIDANVESKASYFIDYDLRRLVKIDGETGSFEPIGVRLPKTLGAWGGVCRLPDNTIFHMGGRKYPHDLMTEYFVVGDTYIENRTVPPYEPLCYHGCVYYSGSVFVFGGMKDQNPVGSAVRYNLNEGAWDALKSLPEPSGFNTSVVVGDCILVTGYHLDKLYAYIPEDDDYISLMDLPVREYKVVCTAFAKVYLMCAGKVYEAQLNKLEQWKAVGDIPRSLSSILSPPTKIGQAIYFMMGKNELWRFNLRNNEVLRSRIDLN